MKDYSRKHPQFALCGLNCALCPMHLGGHCPGCGGGEGHQGCKIIRCSLEQGGVEFCFDCPQYPCGRYERVDEFDSFITHQSMRRDLDRAKELGLEAYLVQLDERAGLLRQLLEGYNDGRRKTMFCLAAALLELEDLRKVMGCLAERTGPGAPVRERAALAAGLLEAAARERGVLLKLRKKKR